MYVSAVQRVRLRDLSARRVRGAFERRRQRWNVVSQLPTGGVGAEIGVWEGDFSSQLLKRVSPSRLYLIDPWEHRGEDTYEHAFFGDRTPGGQAKMDAIHDGVRSRFATAIASGQVVIVRTRSADGAKQVEPLDWAYIDGDHTYEAVAADLENFYASLKPGGVIAGDDYGMVGWWEDGVTRAVDEFVAGRGLELTVAGNQFLFTKPSA